MFGLVIRIFFVITLLLSTANTLTAVLVSSLDGVAYIYDSLNRLVEIRYPDKVVRYTYDDAGNRTGMTVDVLVAAPAISSLSPRGAVVGGSAFVLKIFGSNFSGSSVVQWNGVARAATFISPGELQIALAPSDLTTIGTASVVVVNGANPNLALSNSAQFAIVQQAALSGRVTLGANGLSGVAVALSGSEASTTVTDANGFYNFAVLQNGSYTVSPSLGGYTFDPTNRSLNYTGFTQSNLDFVGNLVNNAPVTISGRVTGRGWALVRPALVSLTDGQGNVRVVDINMFGYYRFTNVPRGASYTLTVQTKGVLVYAPIVVQATDNLTNVDFAPSP